MEIIMKFRTWAGYGAALFALTSVCWVQDSIGAEPRPSDWRAITAKGRIVLEQQARMRQSIVKSLGFKESDVCVATPPVTEAAIDVHRSLLVHDAATLNAGDFTLRRTLQKLADDVSASAPSTTAESIFQQLWDTQNDAANAVLPDNAHCSDNNGKLNGFPWGRCKRQEGKEAIAPVGPRLDNEYKPIAIVNRIDLAGAGWRNCGEHRIAYAKHVRGSPGTGGDFNYLIFEAVLPNPKPGCRSGCRDVVEFWNDLSTDSSPASRAAKLEQFLYVGLPGFRPVVHKSHYSSGVSARYGSSGSGQIRTNQFLEGLNSSPRPWTLKEFKTLLTCTGGTCDFDLAPIPVKSSPFPPLWNADVAAGATPTLPSNNPYATPVTGLASLSRQFQAELLAQITADKLAATDVNRINFSVSPNLNAAASHAEPSEDSFRRELLIADDSSLRDAITTALASFPGLTPKHIANRATGMSCGGCHSPNDMMGASGDPTGTIAPGKEWPRAGHFAHVQGGISNNLDSQAGFDHTHFDMSTAGFALSPALIDSFLPFRRTQLVELANKDFCDCVPARGISIDRPLTPRQLEIVNRASATTRATIRESVANIARPAPQAADQKLRFSSAKSAIRKNGLQRDAMLAEAGLKFETPSLKPDPTLLSKTKVSIQARTKLKAELALKLANSEPPRETVTGSFRVH
jgi:hypothetical protein